MHKKAIPPLALVEQTILVAYRSGKVRTTTPRIVPAHAHLMSLILSGVVGEAEHTAIRNIGDHKAIVAWMERILTIANVPYMERGSGKYRMVRRTA